MSVETYSPSAAFKKAINAYHTAEGKVEQASLNAAKALFNERESIASVGRRALADAAGVSESRISQWRATGDAISRGISDDALLVVNRGTGNAKGRVTSRVLRGALEAIDNGKADAETASAWILANALPGDEEEVSDTETPDEQDEQDTDEQDTEDNTDPLVKAVNVLTRLLSEQDDPHAATHDALAQIARAIVADEGSARKVFAGGLAKSIIAA